MDARTRKLAAYFKLTLEDARALVDAGLDTPRKAKDKAEKSGLPKRVKDKVRARGM